MAIGFIWKKQIVMFITMFLVVFIGLTIGAFLHDTFTENLIVVEDGQKATQATSAKTASQPASDGVTLSPIQTPSLVFPTTKPDGKPSGE